MEWSVKEVTEHVVDTLPDDHYLRPLLTMLADCRRFNTSKQDVQDWITEEEFDVYQEFEDTDEYYIHITKSFTQGLVSIYISWSYECSVRVLIEEEEDDKRDVEEHTIQTLARIPILTPK